METQALTTIVQILETLPEPLQTQVADHLREYLHDLEYELALDRLVEKPKTHLIKIGRYARRPAR